MPSKLGPGFATLLAMLLAFPATAQEGDEERIAVGKTAPDFKATTMDGTEIQLHRSFKGKIVLLDFWATWCPPCRVEVPHLVKAYERYHDDGLAIVGISLDKNRDVGEEKVKTFTSRHEMKWLHVYEGTNDIAAAYEIRFIPMPMLVDGDTGEILEMGNALKGRHLQATIKKHLPESDDDGREDAEDKEKSAG